MDRLDNDRRQRVACFDPLCLTRSCEDLNACTLDDTCHPIGLCVGAPKDCDDNNECTKDFCDAERGCVHDPEVGAACEDGNPCTLGDTCDGAGHCSSGPINTCDDLDECTLDGCDPVIGLCRHALIRPGPVRFIKFIDQSMLEWAATLDASIWNSYHGRIPPGGGMGRRILTGDSPYDQICMESDDVQSNGPTRSEELLPLDPGEIGYYLVTGETTCAEGPMGRASNGDLRPNDRACPTPPPL